MKSEGPTQIRLKIKSADQLAAYKEAEDKLKLVPLKRLTMHKVNVLMCEQLLDVNLKDRLVADRVFALERVDKKDTEAVAKATGARIVGQLSELAEEDLGAADELYIDQIHLRENNHHSRLRGNNFYAKGNNAPVD